MDLELTNLEKYSYFSVSLIEKFFGLKISIFSGMVLWCVECVLYKNRRLLKIFANISKATNHE